MRRDLSCMWLIFLFISLPWNIQTNGQYPNWASTNDFSKSLLCWKLIRFDNLDKTDSFLPAFLQREETRSLKLKSVSITTLIIFVLNSPKFLLHQFAPKYFYVYILKLTNDNCLDLVSCSYFQTNNENNYMKLAKWLSCSNLLIKVFKSLSQAKKVVSSTKLQTSVDSAR